MGFWQSIKKAWEGSSYYPVWMRERALADETGQVLSSIIRPDFHERVELQYPLPDGRMGTWCIERMGPETIAAKRREKGHAYPSWSEGHVRGGRVVTYIMAGPVPEAGDRYASWLWVLGHEIEHILRQIAALWRGWDMGLRGDALQAYADMGKDDVDHQGEGL